LRLNRRYGRRGFSEWQASMTVDIGTPRVRAITRQLAPSALTRCASSRRNTRCGRPRGIPLALAARTPARTRSRMISRSISARAANKCSRKRDIGLSVPVSMLWVGLRKRLDATDAVGHAAAPAVQLPDQDTVAEAVNGLTQRSSPFDTALLIWRTRSLRFDRLSFGVLANGSARLYGCKETSTLQTGP